VTKKITTFCPQCGKTDTWNPNNPDRPFCSARCKLIDLGAWADEKHVIPGNEKIPPEDDGNQE
jgi:uncharacterized protein